MPNRKQRNQPSSRVHDIEFATEISTSLLSQVRNLQALLAEKEESARVVALEKSRLEVEVEGVSQRLRTLDESEQRYKDENWNLETQIHEHIAASKDAADREKRLAHNLQILQAEKATAQKELDEIKLSHSKLSDDHAAILKHHDIELGTCKRNATLADDDRAVLQKKLEDLTGQNQELARAVASYSSRSHDREPAKGLSDEDFETATDNLTPDEGSPPPSPVKGATPRHSMLESETLKSSLHHAHRMIQNLKGNIHREKTEKLELKRMLQDARDELEARRGDSTLGSGNRRSRKVDSREFKKPLRPGQLGGQRTSRNEVMLDETNWEEDDGQRSPSHATPFVTTGPADAIAIGGTNNVVPRYKSETTDTSDAFETANERGTETEDFQTGHEDMSSDDLTETEAVSSKIRPKPAPLPMSKAGNRNSFLSTASNSGDEIRYDDVKTPTATQPQRMRLKMNRGVRRSRQPSEEPGFQSPASFANSSTAGTPKEPSQSLFAELGELGASDDESLLDETPSRSRLATPARQPSLPVMQRPPMVDSCTMTDPWEVEPQPVSSSIATIPLLTKTDGDDDTAIPDTRSSVLLDPTHTSGGMLTVENNADSRPVSTPISDASSLYDQDVLNENLAKFPPPPGTSHEATDDHLAVLGRSVTPLSISPILTEDVLPVSGKVPESPLDPTFPTQVQHVPVVAPEPIPMGLSSIQSVTIQPVSPSFTNNNGVSSYEDGTGSRREASFFWNEGPETPERSERRPRSRVWDSNSPEQTFIAEDETRQSPNHSAATDTPDSQKPFKELSNNAIDKAPRRSRATVVDESSQTALTARQIDDMLLSEQKRHASSGEDSSRIGAMVLPLKSHKSQESIGSVGRARSLMADPDYVNDTVPFKRAPSPAASHRSNSISSTHPPLPTDHKQVIAAAAQRVSSSSGGAGTIMAGSTRAPPGSMGPPSMPASAYKTNPAFRPRTPSQQMTNSYRGGTTPRALHSSNGMSDLASPVRSRRSSISSFTSEVNTRFNMEDGNMMPHGLEPSTDPRMIHAITQTMIGEYLWKYTRKAGRGGMSDNRHRRYFWIHPYTRTLYWSDRDPSTAGRAESKAKSVAIEAVRVVTDDNPMPPGLHRKSLVIMTPGRAVKFTATTGQRHETWFNALSYLLLRTGDNVEDTAEVAGALTADDVDEFMGYGTSTQRGPPSLSSYNSRTTRNESPAHGMNPSLHAQKGGQHASTSSRASVGTLSRLSSYWKPGRESQMSTHGSKRTRQSLGGASSIYEASEVHDSAEDLREVIEKQDRESDKLENVRACCDGKSGPAEHSASFADRCR